MKVRKSRRICVAISILAVASTSAIAQQTVTESVSILDEKVSRLQANVEDVQFRQQQMQKDLDKLKQDMQELRRSAGGVSASDLQALQARIDAVDAARQKDKQAIVDQLAKELASINAPRGSGKAAGATTEPAAPAQGKEHVVQKGEYLSTIARKYGVSVADLKKANNLVSDDIKPGQKLIIPK